MDNSGNKTHQFTFKTECYIPKVDISEEALKNISRIIKNIIKTREEAYYRNIFGLPTMMTNEEFFQRYFPWGVPKEPEKAHKYLKLRMKELGEI